MTTAQLKQFFRGLIKVKPGGPTDVTRGLGLLSALDKLTDEAVLRSNQPGPNDRPDLWKAARWYATDTPGYDGEGPVLTTMLSQHPEWFCLSTRIRVDFTPDGQGRTYRFDYVPGGGQYQVPREFGGPLLDVNLVVEDGSAPPVPGVTVFDNQTPEYLLSQPVFHTIGGVKAYFEALQHMVAAELPGGVIPTPDLAENEFWKNIPLSAGSGAVGRTVLGRGAFAALFNAGQLQAGTEYLILRQLDGERGQPPQLLPSVLVYATTGGSIKRNDATFDPGQGGQNAPGDYDVATDEFTEGGGGGGGSFPANESVATAGTGLVTPGYVRASKSLLQVVRDLTTAPETPPTYYQPSAGLGSTVGGLVKRGTAITPNLTPAFSQGDAGALTSYQLKRGNTTLASDNTAPIEYPAYADNYIIGEEVVTYTAAFGYGQGPVKNGSNGTPYPGGRIPAGAVSAPAQVQGIVPWYYGSASTDTVPDILAGTEVVGLSNGALAVPAFGAGSRWLWFAVPRNADGSRQKLFTLWYRTALDNGSIGGGSNLFRTPTVQSVTTTGLPANWTRDFDLYFSNYPTEAGTPTTLS